MIKFFLKKCKTRNSNSYSICGSCYGYKRIDWKDNLWFIMFIILIGFITFISLGG